MGTEVKDGIITGGIDGRCCIRSRAHFIYKHRRRTELIGDIVADAAVELSYDGMSPVDPVVIGVVEVICLRSLAATLVVGIKKLVAQHQFVVFIDVPVDTGKSVEGLLVRFLKIKAFYNLYSIGIQAIVGVVLEIEVNGLLGDRRVEVFMLFSTDCNRSLEESGILVFVRTGDRRVDIRLGIVVILGTQEYEKLVLDNRSSKCKTIGFGQLLIIFGTPSLPCLVAICIENRVKR